MIGQHPELYGLAETHLLTADSLQTWLDRAGTEPWRMADGLLRVIGQLYWGVQSAETVDHAWRWLLSRSDYTTSDLCRILADRVHPLRLVDKYPGITSATRLLERAELAFPDVRIIHLVRHPVGYCESTLRLREEKEQVAPLPRRHWLAKITTDYDTDSREGRSAPRSDPQRSWLFRNKSICEFLDDLPAERKLLVRGEDLLSDPDRMLGSIASWIGVSTDTSCLDEMKHPERSPFAALGPTGARLGNDVHFLKDPILHKTTRPLYDLGAPVPWLEDGRGLSNEVRDLAEQFGYR
jgi:hypothetical protein